MVEFGGAVGVVGDVLDVDAVVVVGSVVVVAVVSGGVVVVVGGVVVPVVALSEDLQPDASGMDANAVPAATIAALFRNCLLEYLVTRKMAFLP